MDRLFSMSPNIRADLARAVVLAILTALIWCAVYNRWTTESWQTPLTYRADPAQGDVLHILARIRAARDGHHWPFLFTNVPELGAPYAANWDDYPMSEKPLFCLAGLLAKIFGLFAGANLTVMLGQMLAAVSFYAACRILNYSWVWSCAGAMVFALSRFAFAQGLYHLTILYYWHVPLCLVVCGWLLRGEEIRGGRFIFALAVAFVTGVQHVYYANLFAQFVLFGGLVQGWQRGWRAAGPAAAIVGVTALGFLMMETNTFLYQLVNGESFEAFDRSYKWLEIYGLKLVDLVIPPPDHPFPPFAAWGVAHLKEIVLSPGELPPSGYIGLIGLGALGWLVAASFRRVLNRSLPPLETFLVLWIILYATVGGVNGVIGTLGFHLFRATTRYSIFILCIVLMYAIGRLSALNWKRPAVPCVFAVLIVLAVWWDQAPPAVSAQDLDATAQAVASDRHFTQAMEAALPSHAMIFQLPLMEYPETSVPGVGAYDHFRPYLYSHDLRMSFGSEKGRPQESWQRQLAQMPLKGAVDMLESYGFAGIYVNREGFPDKGAGLIKALAALGYKNVIESDQHDLFCVLIQPSLHPVLPSAY
jgi:hypothetical protein